MNEGSRRVYDRHQGNKLVDEEGNSLGEIRSWTADPIVGANEETRRLNRGCAGVAGQQISPCPC